MCCRKGNATLPFLWNNLEYVFFRIAEDRYRRANPDCFICHCAVQVVDASDRIRTIVHDYVAFSNASSMCRTARLNRNDQNA